MSDIPVGSPPAPPGRHAAPSGWYADPLDAGQERYWDGWQWSRNTRAREGGPTAAAGGYPPHPGHQPQDGQPQQPGYPPQQGYPPAGYPQQPGYPPQQGYPPAGYPQQQGYPPVGQTQPWTGHPPGGGGRQAATTADGVPLSGWWWRVLAAVVDGIFVSILAGLASLPILLPLIQRISLYFAEVMEAARAGQAQPPVTPTDLVPVGDSVLLSVIAVAVSFVYQALFLRWRAATPGKLICGLRVVPVDEGRRAERLAWRAVLLRALVWAAPGLNSLLSLVRLLDVLFPLWQPKRQALHDLAARTQVVKP